jgi:formylglycine-generating enzyme required for sulfatase activity
MGNSTNLSLVDIHQFILDTFNEEEFEQLCFAYLGDVKSSLSSNWAFAKQVRELILYCQRSGAMDNLLVALQKERPQPYTLRFAPIVFVPVAPPVVIVRNPHQVFVSHAYLDAEFAHRLASDLTKRGWQVWIAPDSIKPGEKWVAAIERGLDESGVFLVVLTPRTNISAWVKSETESAIALEHEGAIRLFPLMVQPCSIRTTLRAYQCVSFLESYQNGLAQLMAGLELLQAEESVGAGSISATIENTPRLDQVPIPIEVRPQEPSKVIKAPTETPDLLVIDSPFHLDMVRVPAGEFLMGSDPAKDNKAQINEQPQHSVHVSEFYISKYDVTNEQFRVFSRATHRKWRISAGKGNHPVVDVSWRDAIAFCKWLSKVTGREMHLPTEAEWEKAARGTDGRLYPWGNKWDGRKLNSNNRIGDTTPVGKYSPTGDSPYGVTDMAGNVWQWTADWYNNNEYKEHVESDSPIKDPTGPSKGDFRVLRGGAWNNDPDDMRCSFRLRRDPYERFDYIGFRLVLRLASQQVR